MEQKHINAIRGYYSDTMADLAGIVEPAQYCLFYGPLDDYEAWPDYHGFSSACEAIRDALDDVSDVWIESWSEDVTDRDPSYDFDGEEEFDPSEWWHFDRRDVMRALLGELAGYV